MLPDAAPESDDEPPEPPEDESPEELPEPPEDVGVIYWAKAYPVTVVLEIVTETLYQSPAD